MTAEILTFGDDYDLVVAEKIGCELCGFIEPELVAWRKEKNVVHLHCRECFSMFETGDGANLAVIYLPELSVPVFSHLIRSLAWTKFALAVGHTNFKSLADGEIPLKFHLKNKWNYPFQLANREKMERTKIVCQSWNDITDFIRSRELYARNVFGQTSPKDLIEQIGAKKFFEIVRLVPKGLDLERMRQWRQSSFPVQHQKGV